MTQSKKQSLTEAITNTSVGFAIREMKWEQSFKINVKKFA